MLKKKQPTNYKAISDKSKHQEAHLTAYPSHIISMIYNPLAEPRGITGQPDTNILPFSLPRKLASDKRFIKTLNKVQAKSLAIRYPDNFYLHLTKNVLRMKRLLGHPEVVSFPQIRNLLEKRDIQLVAWCWYFAVQWIFLTDTMLNYCSGDYSDSRGLVIQGHKGKPVPISVGMTFDDEVEGLFLYENNAIQILFNPLYIDSDWMLADIIDLAIHECAHAIVFGHNEDFVQVESLLRRELRRIVDQDSILEDATDVLDAFDYPIE